MKKKKPIKSKRKTYDLFHQKTEFQNECHAKEWHILTTFAPSNGVQKNRPNDKYYFFEIKYSKTSLTTTLI